MKWAIVMCSGLLVGDNTDQRQKIVMCSGLLDTDQRQKLNTIVGNPTDFVRKQFQRVLKKEGVIEALYDATPGYFDDIIFNGKQLDIESKAELRNYLELEDFYNSSLFSNIGVE